MEENIPGSYKLDKQFKITTIAKLSAVPLCIGKEGEDQISGQMTSVRQLYF